MEANKIVSRVMNLLVALFILFSTFPAHAQQQEVEYSLFKIGGAIGPKHIPFEVEVSCTPLRMLSRTVVARVRYGTDGYDPKCVVTKVAVSFGRARLEFPKASFEDLADTNWPASLGVEFDGEILILHLSGGDGSGSFKARFYVKGNQLLAREMDDFDEDGEIKTTRQEFHRGFSKRNQ